MTRVRLIVLLSLVLGTSALSVPAAASAGDDTTTTVSCTDSSVATGTQTSCTANVADTSGTTPTPIPTGTVTFSSSPNTSTFGSSGSCTPIQAAPGDTDATCSVSFTPTAGGDYTVQAAYGGATGSPGFQPSTGTTSVTAVDPTTLSLSCSPSTVSINSSTRCTANLTDPNGGDTPFGAVTFGSSPTTGSFSSPICHTTGPGSASCQATFNPTAAGGYTVEANYDPCPVSGIGGCDTHHSASSASTPVRATTAPAGGGPASHGGGSSSLTIPVTSGPPDPGTAAVAPRGTVSKRHVARLLISCAGGSGSRCTGALVLTTKIKVKVKVPVLTPGKGHGHGKKHGRRFKTEKQTTTVLVGLVGYDLAAGTSKAMSFKLKKGALKILARHRRLKTLATTASGSRNVTLVSLKHKKHHKKKHHHKKH